MKKFSGMAAILAVLALTGCVSTGEFNGLDPDPKRWMIVMCTDGPSDGSCTPAQRELAAQVIIDGARFAEKELSGRGEAALAGGFASAIASAVATALTVTNPFAGAALVISAADNASQGVIASLGSYSFALVYAATEAATAFKEDRLKQKKPGYEIGEYVRIIPAFVKATTSMEQFRAGEVPGP